jgi:hypothetical protein
VEYRCALRRQPLRDSDVLSVLARFANEPAAAIDGTPIGSGRGMLCTGGNTTTDDWGHWCGQCDKCWRAKVLCRLIKVFPLCLPRPTKVNFTFTCVQQWKIILFRTWLLVQRPLITRKLVCAIICGRMAQAAVEPDHSPPDYVSYDKHPSPKTNLRLPVRPLWMHCA